MPALMNGRRLADRSQIRIGLQVLVRPALGRRSQSFLRHVAVLEILEALLQHHLACMDGFGRHGFPEECGQTRQDLCDQTNNKRHCVIAAVLQVEDSTADCRS